MVSKNVIKKVLTCAMRAPSTHNSQPWLFRINENSCEIFTNPRIHIVHGDPKQRDLYISMGACIENMMIAAWHFGIYKDLKIDIDRTTHRVATMFFQVNPTTVQQDLMKQNLYTAIEQRMNVRGTFDKTSLPQDLFTKTKDVASEYGVEIAAVVDEKKRHILAHLTAEGLRTAYRNPDFRKEISAWMHSNVSSAKDGLHGYSLRMPLLTSFILPTLVKFVNLGKILAQKNYESIASAPAVFVISSPEKPESWIQVGRCYERIALLFASRHVQCSVFVAAIEMGFQKEVKKIVDSIEEPQFIFCAGYMKSLPRRAPRFSLEDKLLPLS